ncbi:MAG TPA: hypothetical protein PLS95_09375, partial [Thermoanaerobaculales bacterium]|nr:hypothetical protein [Thermoanaerobaculales bacterium]
MKLRALLLLALALPALAPAAGDEDRPLALSVEVRQLGRGADGTVVGIVIQVAPEDRPRVGERGRVLVTLLDGEDIVDRHAAVVAVGSD